MTENRKRNQTLTVRLTAAEKDAITQKAAKARMSLTDYIVASSLLTEIHVAEDTRPLLTELKRIGNNLNQIARHLNEWRSPYPAMAKELQDTAADLATLKFEVMKKVGDAIGNVQAYKL